MLNHDLLQNKKTRGDKTIARCPACAEAGGDATGNHLVVYPSGKFACVACPGDKEHQSIIWSLVGTADKRPKLSQEEKKAWRLKKRAEVTARLTRSRRQQAAREQHSAILRDFQWDEETILASSPRQLTAEAAMDWRRFVGGMYAPEAILWIGERWHSGEKHGQGHFAPAGQWVKQSPSQEPRWPLICPDHFLAGSVSRSAANVVARPYLLVEADNAVGFKPTTAEERAANIRANLALIRWLHGACGWTLRAINLTGGKSAHGWFERPPPEHIQQLQEVAALWGIDTSVFAPGHPVRLPGVRHEGTGESSRLIYWDPPFAES